MPREEGGGSWGNHGFPHAYAPGTIRTCDLCLRRAALYPLSYGRGEGECSCVAARRADCEDDRVVGDLAPYVGERETRPASATALVIAAHDLAVERQLGVVGAGVVAVEREDAQAAVRVAAVVQPCDRLLAGVAALREADRALLETRLGREDPVVELAPPGGRAGQDPQPLELVGARSTRLEPSASSSSYAGTP